MDALTRRCMTLPHTERELKFRVNKPIQFVESVLEASGKKWFEIEDPSPGGARCATRGGRPVRFFLSGMFVLLVGQLSFRKDTNISRDYNPQGRYARMV